MNTRRMKSSLENPFAHTPVHFEIPLKKIAVRDTICSIGSCFAADLIGNLLSAGFRGAQNPNGILYHPLPLSDALQHIDFPYTESDFFQRDGLWHSWMHHGSFSGPALKDALEHVETSRKIFLKALKKASVCFITLSNAVAYRHLPSARVVANCHKVPGAEFERILSSEETCFAALLCILRKIRELNPECAAVFTLSPVRHMPGDLILNAAGKARLLSAIHRVLEREENCAYFPAFEIMMDELRDYRFYADDLLHPSPAAEKILLERLLQSCFEPGAIDFYHAAEEKRRTAAHHTIHPAPVPPEGE